MIFSILIRMIYISIVIFDVFMNIVAIINIVDIFSMDTLHSATPHPPPSPLLDKAPDPPSQHVKKVCDWHYPYSYQKKTNDKSTFGGQDHDCLLLVLNICFFSELRVFIKSGIDGMLGSSWSLLAPRI